MTRFSKVLKLTFILGIFLAACGNQTPEPTATPLPPVGFICATAFLF
jgi:hypothetical protein